LAFHSILDLFFILLESTLIAGGDVRHDMQPDVHSR
jgi:hypothetical protein